MAQVSSTGNNRTRLTNVAIVRLKRAGRRFEVAAYKNKVINWRSGAEADIANVLQLPSVFTNVSRGVRATAADMLAAFGTDDQMACARVVLEKGDLEKGELERTAEFDGAFRDVAATVAERCVNPGTRRPYPVAFVEAALRDAGFSVAPGKSAKQQAARAVAALRGTIPIERAKMALRIALPARDLPAARAALAALGGGDLVTGEASVVRDDGAPPDDAAAAVLDILAEPGYFRIIEEGAGEGGRARGARRGAARSHVPCPLPPPPQRSRTASAALPRRRSRSSR